MALVLRKNIIVTKRKEHHKHILRELHHVCLENTKGNSGILMWKHLFPFSPSRHLSFPAKFYTKVFLSCGVGGAAAAVRCCEQWMDHERCGRAVKDKGTTEKTGNSMSSGLRADGREAGGRGRKMGPYLP